MGEGSPVTTILEVLRQNLDDEHCDDSSYTNN
jgi:hypothetical protein